MNIILSSFVFVVVLFMFCLAQFILSDERWWLSQDWFGLGCVFIASTMVVQASTCTAQFNSNTHFKISTHHSRLLDPCSHLYILILILHSLQLLFQSRD